MKTDKTVHVLFLKSLYYLHRCATQFVQQVEMLSRGWRPRRTQTVWTQTRKDVLRGGVGLLFCYFHPVSVLSREDGARLRKSAQTLHVIITQRSLVKGDMNHEWSELCGSTSGLWRSLGGNNEGRGVFLLRHPKGQRENTCQVWRDHAVRCIVGHVAVQRCCHGDTLRQSVPALGVRGCKSAYATSALILTAGAAGKRLTCIRACARQQVPPIGGSEARGMQRRPFFREAESG